MLSKTSLKENPYVKAILSFEPLRYIIAFSILFYGINTQYPGISLLVSGVVFFILYVLRNSIKIWLNLILNTNGGTALLSSLLLIPYVIIWKIVLSFSYVNYGALAYKMINPHILTGPGEEVFSFAINTFAYHMYVLTSLLPVFRLQEIYVLFFVIVSFFSIFFLLKLISSFASKEAAFYTALASLIVPFLATTALLGTFDMTAMLNTPFVLGGLYFLVKRKYVYSGIFLGIAFNFQPPSTLIVVFLSLGILYLNKRVGFVPWILSFLAVASPMIARIYVNSIGLTYDIWWSVSTWRPAWTTPWVLPLTSDIIFGIVILAATFLIIAFEKRKSIHGFVLLYPVLILLGVLGVILALPQAYQLQIFRHIRFIGIVCFGIIFSMLFRNNNVPKEIGRFRFEKLGYAVAIIMSVTIIIYGLATTPNPEMITFKSDVSLAFFSPEYAVLHFKYCNGVFQDSRECSRSWDVRPIIEQSEEEIRLDSWNRGLIFIP